MKNHGYELEHNFGHGETFLAMTLAALNLLAFAWHTALDLLEPPWRAARQAATKRTAFFALKSAAFCSRSQAENPHILRVLPLGDEFRERIAFCGSEEKFGKCLAQRVCDDKFRWRDTGTNGSQPRAELLPDKFGSNDGEILEQSLGDDAGLDEGMIGADFAFDAAAVVGRFCDEVLIAVAVTQRDHVHHPEMVGE